MNFLAKRISKISRRGWIRIISFSIASNIATGIFCYMQVNAVNKYSRRLQYDYEQQLYSLSEYLGDIDDDLKLSAYISTPSQFAKISSSVWQNCGSAKACISSLPTSISQLDNTYRFLSQTGEYMKALSVGFSNGNKLTAEQKNTLKTYSRYASALSKSISSLRDELEANGDFDNFAKKVAFNSDDELQNEFFYTSLNESEKSLKDIPNPTYDGPFSSHIVDSASSYLSSLKEVSQDEALKNLCNFLGISVSDVKYLGMSSEEDKYSSYRFEYNGGYYAVTVKGGLLSYYITDTESKTKVLSTKECLSSGERFIEKLGFGQFCATYYEIADTVLTAEFAFTENGVYYLTDTIKLSIASDTGEIISYDAKKFLLYHKQREERKPKYSKETALSVLDPSFTVQSSSLVIIPCDNVCDVYCYEFICRADPNTNVIIFINADTLEEEKICIVDENSTGTYL